MDQKKKNGTRETETLEDRKKKPGPPSLGRKIGRLLSGELFLESQSSDPNGYGEGGISGSRGVGKDYDYEEEEEVLLSEIKTPEDLAPYLVSAASKYAMKVSKYITVHPYFFRDFLSYRSSSPFGDLPTPYVISHSPQIEGVVTFKYNDEEEMFNQLIEYTKDVFVDRIRKAFGIPEEAEFKVNLFGTEDYSEIKGKPRKYKNIVFPVYLAALMLEEESKHRVLAEDLLGVEIKVHSKDRDYIVELSNSKSGLKSLPGFRI